MRGKNVLIMIIAIVVCVGVILLSLSLYDTGRKGRYQCDN